MHSVFLLRKPIYLFAVTVCSDVNISGLTLNDFVLLSGWGGGVLVN